MVGAVVGVEVGVVVSVRVWVWVGASCGHMHTDLVLIKPCADHRLVRPRAEGLSQA